MRRLALILLFFSAFGVHAQSYYLLVGTYTNMGSNSSTPPQDSTGSKGIYVYRWDAATGKAVFLSHTTGVVNPSFLDIAPDGRHVYAVTETRTAGAGSVSAFSLDRGPGTLSFINKVPSGGDNPVYVSVHRSGRWAAVANYTGGSLSVFPIRADGALLPYVQNLQHNGHSVNPARQEKSHVHSVVFSPDYRTLYAQDLGEDSISIYGFDSVAPLPLRGRDPGEPRGSGGSRGQVSGSGEQVSGSRGQVSGSGEQVSGSGEQVSGSPEGVAQVQAHKAGLPASPEKIATTPGSGPRHLTFHPNGKYAYLIEELGGCVDVFRYYPGTGHLQLLQRIAAHADTAKGPFRSSDIHVSADGAFLYASNRESERNLAIFAVDPAKGALRAIGYQSVLGKEPRNFILDPTGHFLLVANQDSNAVVVFRIDKTTGLPEPTGQRIEVPSPSCLKMVR